MRIHSYHILILGKVMRIPNLCQPLFSDNYKFNSITHISSSDEMN